MTSIEEESAALDGYFSDTPLDPKPNYPPLRDTFETSIIVLNLPRVPKAKLEKLTKVVKKLVSRIGPLVGANNELADNAAAAAGAFNGIELPFDESKDLTSGCAFVEYESAEHARQALEVLADYKFDKNHILTVVPFERAETLVDLQEEEFTEPEPAPFVEKPNTTEWLQDLSQRDQFVLRHGRETAVYWSDGKHDPVLDYDGAREKAAGVAWCEYYVHWSPRGSFLATLVPSKGVILWGGKTYEKLARFPAPGVQFVLFSPQENYLLTNNNNRNDPNAIKVFHIPTGKLLRTFPLFPPKFIPDGATVADAQNIPPPPFQWSHDDQFLARMGKDLISIYEAPSMKLLDKRSLTADGIHEFQFSPKANILAYWCPEHQNTPAHIDLIQLPSRKKLRQRNLVNVNKCSMVWHEQGHYLGVKVTRHTKSKKTLFNNLELFRLNDEVGVPVEKLDIKDAVMAFAWEPQGSRFAMIHAENPSSTKVNVSFYDMMKKVEPKKGAKKGGNTPSGPQKVAELNKVITLEGRQCNCIFWSPAGSTIILASLGESASGTLEFYDVDTKSLTQKEHYRANQVLWDPSGRTVATLVSQPIGGGHFKFAMDNGYILWSFQGKQLHQQSYETFYQFQWRRRQSLLTEQQTKDVVKNLKRYEREFDKADRERSRALYLEETKGKRLLRSAFRDRLAQLRSIYVRQKEGRMELNDGYDSDDESNFVIKEIVMETTLSTKEESVL